MGAFERNLSLWVGLAIAAGLGLGTLFPGVFAGLAALEYGHVNLAVAVLIWGMIYPMMVSIDFGAVSEVRKQPKGLVLTLVVNWLIKPFSMAILGWLFFGYIFAGFVTPEDGAQYVAGMILLGAAPCTAMVFVWSRLTKGDPNYTLVQVAVNDVIMIFAFAPLVALLLGVAAIIVPWETLLLSVGLYVVLPLVAGYITRKRLEAKGDPAALDGFLARLKPYSAAALLLMVVLLFGLQAPTILANPLPIVLIAIPLLIQSYGIFAVTYAAAQKMGLPHSVAAPAAMIGTSNFFELAVAVAVSLFGLNSGAALATVVGVLVEVPVMLSLVAYANRTRDRFPA